MTESQKKKSWRNSKIETAIADGFNRILRKKLDLSPAERKPSVIPCLGGLVFDKRLKADLEFEFVDLDIACGSAAVFVQRRSSRKKNLRRSLADRVLQIQCERAPLVQVTGEQGPLGSLPEPLFALSFAPQQLNRILKNMEVRKIQTFIETVRVQITKLMQEDQEIFGDDHEADLERKVLETN